MSTAARLRIRAQGLLRTAPDRPVAEVAQAFGAHQAQDLPGVMASLALRARPRDPAAGLAEVAEAFSSGALVRGYPMRGTVFAVAAEDLRWMTELCSAGPVRAARKRRPQLGLEEQHVTCAREAFERIATPASAPGSGRGVLRAEVFAEWERAGLDTGGGRGYHLLTHLISTGAAAYGPWREEETALVHAESWLPAGSSLGERFGGDPTAATAELLRRYLVSHGPATLRDFAWWTKLPLGQVRKALPLIADDLETAEPAACGLPGEEPALLRPGLLEEHAAAPRQALAELLLPGFDELVLGYPDRLFLMTAEQHTALVPGNNGVFKRGAFRGARLVGTWTRTGAAGRRKLVLDALAPLTPAQRARFERLFAAFPYTRP